MSIDSIQPGSVVNVKVVKRPTNEAARKTLIRVLSKDEEAKAENKRLRKTRDRHYTPRMRGGRLYGGQMKKLLRIKGEIGDKGTIQASVDVLNDLNSISRFIEVTKA